MLKLNTSFQKKVPIPGQEYSSQSFHASVEVELSDALKPEEVKSRIHDTFLMVKQAVEEELNGTAKATIINSPNNRIDLPDAESDKASNKQISYILSLAQHRQLGIDDLTSSVHKEFGVDSIYQLTRKQASAVVDLLKDRRSKQSKLAA